RCLEKGGAVSYEESLTLPAGEKTWHTVLTPVIKGGKVKAIVGSSRDISARKEKENIIRKEKECLSYQTDLNKKILNSALTWINMLDAGGNVTFWNKKAAEISGYSPKEVLGHGKVWQWLYPDEEYRLDILKKMEGIINEGKSEENLITCIKTKYGCFKTILWYSNSIEAEGEKKGSVAIGIDISEKIEMERKLRRSEESFRHLSENARDLIYRYEVYPQPGFTYVSPSALAITGYSPQEHYEDPELGFKLVHPEDRHIMQQMLEGKKNYDKAIRLRWIRKDGREIWTEQKNTPVYDKRGRLVAIEGIARDVSSQKKAEEKIIEQKNFIKTVLDNLPVGIGVVNGGEKFSFSYLNDNFFRIYRISREKISSLSSFWQAAYEDPEFRKEIKEKVEKDCLSADPARMKWNDIPIYRKGELKGYISAQNTWLPDSKQMISTVWDVSKQKMALDRLSEQAQLNKLIAAISSNFIDVTENSVDNKINRMLKIIGEFFDVDRAYLFRIPSEPQNLKNIYEWHMDKVTSISDFFYGRSPEHSMPWLYKNLKDNDVVHVPDVDSLCARANKDKEALKARGVKSMLAVLIRDRFYNPLGFIGFDSVRYKKNWDEGQVYLLKLLSSVVTDAFENIRMQRVIAQSNKMETVGRLAGGVAHDFNNMLTAIISNAELAMEELGPEHSVYDDLKEIYTAGKRAAEMTSQLLAFGKKQVIKPKKVNLNKLVEELIKMLGKLVEESISINWHPAKDLWPVKIDPSQLSRIFTNLAVNSRDAMGGSGSIDIETDNVLIEKNSNRKYPQASGKYVRIKFSDNGKGISKENMSHIFEPYFSSGKESKHTGLGLSTVYGIVEQNNGFIDIYSELDTGTTVKIYLPALENDERFEDSEDVYSEIKARGKETVLLVEDEEMVLKSTERKLRNLGYEVIGASRPSRALELAHENKDKIDLLLTDIIMPEVNGKRLQKEVLSIIPDIKVVYMSGYTSDIIQHNGVLEGGINFLRKPFTTGTLASKLRVVLDN
ncbi:MAG: PAS domain S-box protein, partial [Elusimicrobiota bacterium]